MKLKKTHSSKQNEEKSGDTSLMKFVSVVVGMHRFS